MNDTIVVCEQKTLCPYVAACYDPLTRLPNYYLFREQFLRTTSADQKRCEEYSAFLLVSLDQYRTINFACGKAVTDRLLLEALQRIRMLLPENNTTLAHIESDQFLILLEYMGQNVLNALHFSSLLASQINQCLINPYEFNNDEFRCANSIGLCLFRRNNESIEELFKHTHIAMRQAQLDGGNTWRFFDPVMHQAMKERHKLEAELSYALPKQQLVLLFQAQVDRQQRILGAEILLRWQHPTMGLVPPAKFIPIAEETGQIIAIGYWLIKQACIQLKSWENDPHLCDMRLSVNVSAKQFHQTDFVHHVFLILDETGVNPEKLKMEITESVMISDIDNIILKMNKLKSRGIHLSIDDFGTGYSSLAYLGKMPLDQLKIDQQFVKNITINSREQAIAKVIIAMAGALNFGVIAEGVETEEQRIFLEDLGCPNYQGYLYCKPEPLDAFKNRVKQFVGNRSDAPSFIPPPSQPV